MPARHTKQAHLALLVPMAISQGWSARAFAQRAGIAQGEACEILRTATKNAVTAIESIESIDALALSVEVNGVHVTLGKVQGELVTGAVTALAQTPPNPRDWARKDQDGYNNAMRMLKDAKALGLIRFGEADKGQNLPTLRQLDPFLSQPKAEKRGETENPPAESASVNDGADSSPPLPVVNPQERGEEGE